MPALILHAKGIHLYITSHLFTAVQVMQVQGDTCHLKACLQLIGRLAL